MATTFSLEISVLSQENLSLFLTIGILDSYWENTGWHTETSQQGKLIQRKTAEMRGNKLFYGFCDFMSEQDALFERLARERNITVEEMKEIISARILKGWNDTNPIK